MGEPLVSVIIPAYCCAATLGQAIDSALAQSVSTEVLVIDDCSPEDLGAVMARYRDNEAVVYRRNGENRGAAASRNRGVALARGKYVAFLDGDDWWAPDKLARQVALLEKTGAPLCATARRLVRPDGTVTDRVLPIRETVTYRDLLHHNSIACSSALMPAAIARAHPLGHEALHEDYILWLEILRQHGAACGINEPLLYYRVSSAGKSGGKLRSAAKTYGVYRQQGFGTAKSLLMFVRYACNGVWKYYLRAAQPDGAGKK